MLNDQLFTKKSLSIEIITSIICIPFIIKFHESIASLEYNFPDLSIPFKELFQVPLSG